MGVQNGGQRPGLRRRGAPVKKQTCNATGVAIADRLRDAKYGRPQAYCRAVASLDSWKFHKIEKKE